MLAGRGRCPLPGEDVARSRGISPLAAVTTGLKSRVLIGSTTRVQYSGPERSPAVPAVLYARKYACCDLYSPIALVGVLVAVSQARLEKAAFGGARSAHTPPLLVTRLQRIIYPAAMSACGRGHGPLRPRLSFMGLASVFLLLVALPYSSQAADKDYYKILVGVVRAPFPSS